MVKITFTWSEKIWLKTKISFSLSTLKLTSKFSVLLKDEVLISGMNFCWNSRNGKTQKLTKAWGATAANTTWCCLKRTSNWKRSWWGKKIDKQKEKELEEKRTRKEKMRIIEAKNQELNNRYHIETSQWAGFYMINASIMKRLNV